MAKFAYRKYPAFVKTLCERHIKYNETIKRIAELEKEGKAFVIRPEKTLDIGRLENNPEKIQAIYDIGYADGEKYIEEMKKWLSENN